MPSFSPIGCRICALSIRDWCMLAESALVLVVASVLIRLLPFRRLAQIISTGRLDGDGADHRATISKISWALNAVARRLPWRAVCIHKGIAAQFMLRRRGLPNTLHYGIRSREGLLKAHVWVISGVVPVVGVEEAHQFACVATFPPTIHGSSALS